MNRGVPLVFFAILAAGAQANIVSTFDTGDEGWTTAAVNPLTLGILGTGTPIVSGGQLKAIEIPGGLFVLVAPTKFLGNRLAFYGGSLSYDLADETQNTGTYYSAFLHGNGLSISHLTAAPTVAGTTFVLPLTSSGWLKNVAGVPTAISDAEFRSVLSGLDILAINGDWTAGGTDRVSLDNVILAAPVPEPATMVALALGIVGFARRKKSLR